jgi:hypothetical protein
MHQGSGQSGRLVLDGLNNPVRLSQAETMDAQTENELSSLATEFFQAVSFTTGEKPDYQRIHDLFVEGGLLIKNTGPAPEISSVEGFIAPRQALVDSAQLTAFEETEIDHRIDVFGQIAHYLCTYAKSAVTNGVASQGRGVVSIQFVRTAGAWKMSSMVWDDERDGLTIPTL